MKENIFFFFLKNTGEKKKKDKNHKNLKYL